MRISALAGALTLLGLAACSAGPESYASMTTGVGFGDYQRYLRDRSTAQPGVAAPYSVPPETRGPGARGQTAIVPPGFMPPAPTTLDAVPPRYAPAPQPVAQPVAPAAAPPPITARPLAAPMQAPAATPAPAPTATMQPVAPPGPGTTVRTVQADATFGTTPAFDAGPSVRPGVSDEQDFQAVSARESIESDRDRIARQRAQYQVIEVTSVPDSSVSGGPNLVAYALGTSHAPGTQVHRRINPLRWSRNEDACLQFRNQDAAQEAFLADGGPGRDPGHLDPDGDGYACWWDPTPIRQAMASR